MGAALRVAVFFLGLANETALATADISTPVNNEYLIVCINKISLLISS
ncbi:MAG: hypothetical protein J6I69_02925 [Bacilli bacterium]|nr:hypothetical protein [Bacilli bacterium]